MHNFQKINALFKFIYVINPQNTLPLKSMMMDGAVDIANWQTVWSSIASLQKYEKALIKQHENPIPSLHGLQCLLESAWKNGFDKDGANQLHHCVVGTTKWIGATEIVAGFRFLSIKARIVDFWRPTTYEDLQLKSHKNMKTNQGKNSTNIIFFTSNSSSSFQMDLGLFFTRGSSTPNGYKELGYEEFG